MPTKRPEKTSFIKEVALLVSQKGLEIEKTLVALNKDNGKKFSFLRRSDPYHAYYQDKLNYYRKEAQATRPHAAATTTHDCSAADGEEETFCLLPTYSTLWSSSYSRPAGISLEDLYIMKLTAQFIARYDMHFLRALKEHVAQNPKPRFDFLKPTSSRFNFCGGLVRGYASVIRPYIESLMRDGGGIMPLVLPSSVSWTRDDDYDGMPLCLQFFFERLQLEKLEAGDKMAMIDLHAFVSGVDFFAQRDNEAFATVMPKTPHLSKMMYEWPQMQPSKLVNNNTQGYDDDDTEPELIDAPPSYEILEKQLTLKELGIIKVTAMFVARYGSGFRRDLMEIVSMNPLFEFLRPSDCKCSKFFTSLVIVYSNVIMPSDKLWYGDDCTDSALEFFSSCLQLEKLENGDETAAIDLHALVGGVDCFSHMSESLFLAFAPQPERLSTMVKRRGCQLLTEFRKADRIVDGVARPYRFKSSFKFPETGITVRELGVIMLTAQFVDRYGENFRLGMRRRVVMNTQFGFMVFGDRRHDFYCGILYAYSSVLRPCKRMKKSDACTDTVLEVFFEILQSQEEGEGIELHDFVGVVDSFAHVEDEQYSVVVPAPVHVLMNMIPRTLRLPDTLLLPPVKSSSIHDPAPRRPHDLASPTRRYTLREDCIIKVTAQFVARYGTKFTRALARRVAETTQFEFMNPTSGRSRFYTWYVERLGEVLRPCEKRVACMNTVLEDFFSCLDRLQQEEEEAVGVALHGFVDVVDCFASMDHVLNQHLAPPGSQVNLGAYGQPLMGMMQRAPPKLGVMSLPPPLPLPEEPEPKRRKFDVSALAPEDRLHNFQGWSTIRVFVPNVGEVVIRK
ncbi:hypothetical protein Bca4012_047974 [Brassica carinata]